MYRVIFLDGSTLDIKADNFNNNDEAKRIYFLENNTRIAGFNFNNIIGFYYIEEENE